MPTRLAGVALSCAGERFVACAFDGDRQTALLERHARDANADHELKRLLSDQPIVTDAPHTPAFRGMLERLGLRQRAEVWDVLELGALVLPHARIAMLDDLALFLGHDSSEVGLKRRVELTLACMRELVSMLDALDTPTLLHLVRLATPLDWPLKTLFRRIEASRARSALEQNALANATPIGAWIAQGGVGVGRRRHQTLQPAAEPPPLDLDDVAVRLAPDSAIAHTMPAFEPRHEQVYMAQLIGRALNGGGQLLVEAGTGTGKSLAYLLPAAMQAVASQQRVIVSTATTTLQDQLFEQDLPLVQAALSDLGPVRATVLKGRANYLCLRRWQTLLHAPDLGADERSLLIKTLFWLPRTRTGDRAELSLSPGEEDAWTRINALAEGCTPQRCSYHRIGVCFLVRARRTAEESHIVIANHALLLSDLVSRSRVLPDYDVLIVDEAHHLEHEATMQLGWRLGERELIGRLERLWNPGVGATGAVPEALALIATAHGLQVPADLLPSLKRAEMAVLEFGSDLHLVFEGLSRLLEDAELGGTSAGGEESSLRLTAAVRAGSAWQDLERVWTDALSSLAEVERGVVEVTSALETLPSGPEAARDVAAELGTQMDYWRDVKRRMSAALHGGPEHNGLVQWVSGGGRFRSAFLNAAPLEVASLLRERLFATPRTSVLVSATLAIAESFDYVKNRLGLEDAESALLGSPFDYGKAALLYVPNDLPDPTQSGYQTLLERAVLDTVARLGGRTLVLFTSRAHLRATYQALREPLRGLDITPLGQGIDESSRTRLLHRFRAGARVVLFGTNAFWEGIDVVGEALSCVIVARLPFAVPTDPVYAARAEQFDDPFMQYAVPQAVLRLKQGFGRLIRSRSDRGAVVVVDRRLVTRFYGQVFVRSLPPCSVLQGPLGRTGAEVETWLGPELSSHTEVAQTRQAVMQLVL